MRAYLDFNASTPVAPEVAARMQAVLYEPFGNPSSDHWAGTPARDAVETARAQVAAHLGCNAGEVIFTSGGSEANNHALKGVFFARRFERSHIITTQIEHPPVVNPCRFLERLGATITCLPVDAFGRVDPDDVQRAVTPDTILISVMHANNEVGTIQPIAEIGRIAREHGILLHTDAAQSIGKIPTKVGELGVDLLKALAREGARARLAELTAEIESLRKAFPDLSPPARGRRRAARARRAGPEPAAAPAKARRRRKAAWSAAQRRAVSERMKKYWAQRRKAKA
jgi:cysteine desulfurase